MPEKILEVTEIELITLETFPPRLQIKASGQVPTGGWSKTGELIQYVYVTPPADGYYEFDFVAEPPEPDAIVIQVLTPIPASFVLESIPDDLKGVKIYASSNSLTKAYYR